MTILIQHRSNSLELGSSIPSWQGAEIDLRLSFGDIVLAHDPLINGCKFAEWLKIFQGQLLVLNVKEMGLEDYLVNILSEVRPELTYFFLDLATPYLVRSVRKGYVCAARVSEYESIECALKQKTSWLWIDSFSGNWDYIDQFEKFAEISTKKLCLVSPELQGRDLASSPEPRYIFDKMSELGFRFEAICTKSPELWMRW